MPLVWSDQRQQMLLCDQHETQPDTDAAEIAGARYRAASKHERADQNKQKRNP